MSERSRSSRHGSQTSQSYHTHSSHSSSSSKRKPSAVKHKSHSSSHHADEQSDIAYVLHKTHVSSVHDDSSDGEVVYDDDFSTDSFDTSQPHTDRTAFTERTTTDRSATDKTEQLLDAIEDDISNDLHEIDSILQAHHTQMRLYKDKQMDKKYEKQPPQQQQRNAQVSNSTAVPPLPINPVLSSTIALLSPRSTQSQHTQSQSQLARTQQPAHVQQRNIPSSTSTSNRSTSSNSSSIHQLLSFLEEKEVETEKQQRSDIDSNTQSSVSSPQTFPAYTAVAAFKPKFAAAPSTSTTSATPSHAHSHNNAHTHSTSSTAVSSTFTDIKAKLLKQKETIQEKDSMIERLKQQLKQLQK